MDALILSRSFAVSTHSRAEAAANFTTYYFHTPLFQHTAAQRRLRMDALILSRSFAVSTHSRAEAAALDRPNL